MRAFLVASVVLSAALLVGTVDAASRSRSSSLLVAGTYSGTRCTSASASFTVTR